MLANFFSYWNPLNIYGDRIGVEDLIIHPLESDETLMEDSTGCCHRIRTPSNQSNIWKKIIYWFQIHLNENDFPIASDHLIMELHRILLDDPPTLTQRLAEFYTKIEKLESLKKSDESDQLEEEIAQIDAKLLSLRRIAYLIFAYSHHEHVKEKELSRKERFFLFKEIVSQNLSLISQEYIRCAILDRLLIIVTEDKLKSLFSERCASIKHRLDILQDTNAQINEIEDLHLGKFTIPHIKRIIRRLRSRVQYELRKLVVEAGMMVDQLIINFQIYPKNHAVATLLEYLIANPHRNEKKKRVKEIELFDDESKQLSQFIDYCLLS
jgi:hypothetical protein